MRNPQSLYPEAIPQSTENNPAANTAAVVTLAATEGQRHVVRRVVWSYDGDPTGGLLSIVRGSETHKVAITNGGPGFLPFDIVADENQAVTITLSAGGAGVTGTLSVTHY